MLSILTVWPCHLPCTQAGPGCQDGNHVAENNTHYLHNLAPVFSFKVQGFMVFFFSLFSFFLRCQPAHGGISKKQESWEEQPNTINGTSGSEQLLGRSPRPAQAAGSEQGFPVTAPLFLNHTQLLLCC